VTKTFGILSSVFVLLSSVPAPAERPAATPGRVTTLASVNALPPDVIGRLRDPVGCTKIPGGPFYLFDRRGHSVHTVQADGSEFRTLVEIGGEEGRLLEPSAFDAADDGSFAVADAPGGRERIQIFGAAGLRTGGFTRPGRAPARVTIGSLVLSGVGSLVYTGRSVILSEPDSGWLLTEYGLLGTPLRSVGALRATGHEADRDLHLALNAALALPAPDGGFYVVFLTGTPAFRRYAKDGDLMFERVIQGREIDPLVSTQPQRWPRRTVGDRQLPLVPPVVRTAAVDPAGRLWVSFVVPFTYVFDADGEKARTVQFRAAGIISPAGLSFMSSDRLLVAPGCYEFVV
jgi:hypothetical protein